MPVDVFVDVVSVVAFQAAMLEMNQENEGIKPAVSFCVHFSHLLTMMEGLNVRGFLNGELITSSVSSKLFH